MKECQCISSDISKVVECVPHPAPKGEKELGGTPNPGRRAGRPPAPPAWRFALPLFPELCVKAFHVYAFYQYGDQIGGGR